MSNLKILVTGCRGRMGQAVIEACEENEATEVGAYIDMGDSIPDALALSDSVIDFTTHSFSTELVEACVKANKPLIMGTTGHTDEELATIQDASQHIPLVHAPNFSIGVNTLFWLTEKATQILGTDYDLEVVEMHHRHKIDSPSGTARRLGEILAEGTQVDYNEDVMHGRHGVIGARTGKEIGMHAIRGGDVVGDHTVIYAGQGERVELTHKASSRQTFARGAVRAAVWLKDHGPGHYDMQDVLGLRE